MSLTVGQYLTVLIFEVDGHRFGLETSQIMEVVRAVQPARLAQAPDIVEGVINVRGRLAAVVDLRARFELRRRPIVPSDALVLCELGERLVALRVDLTLDLQTIAASELAQLAQVSPAAHLVQGAVTTSDGVLLICDLAAFLSESDQLSLTRALARRAAEEASA